MKKLISFIVASFLITGCGTSNDNSNTPVVQTQNPFIKEYTLNNIYSNAVIAKLIISSSTNTNDGYIFSGSITIDQNNTDNRGDDGLIIKTDYNGSLIKAIYVMYNDENVTRSYPVNENFYDVAKSFNNIYITITQISPTGSYSGTTNFLTLFDENLNVLSAGLYKTSLGGLYAKHVKAMNDGSFLLIGDADVTQDEYGNIRQLGTVTKIDSNGNVIWSKSYSSSQYYINYGYGSSVGDDWHYQNAVITNDAIYISGYSINSYAQSSILLIKLDLNGNFIWAKEYNRKKDDNYYPSVGYDIINIDDNLVIPFKDNDNTYTTENYGTLKIDYNGNIIDNKIYYHGTYLDEIALDNDNDNNIYIGYGSDFIKTDLNLIPYKSYSIYGGIKKNLEVDDYNNVLFFSFNQGGSYAQFAQAYVTKFVNDKSCNISYSSSQDINITTEHDIFETKEYNSTQTNYNNVSIIKNNYYKSGSAVNIKVIDMCN